MRLFVAVEASDEIKAKAQAVISRIRLVGADVKFVEPENMHFTLKFLGDVQDGRVKEVEDAISKAVSGFRAFAISVERLGYFGSRGQINTIWLDSGQGREELVKLAAALNAALDGIRHEDREPHPHLTIGRVRSARNRQQLIDMAGRLKDAMLGGMQVSEVKLKRSVLSSSGPEYSDVKVFTLT